uniref:Uncharacterized protein n=1 Tax=Leishmania guyanensis TaxID=5670 RepID=A0A1E1J0V4_LEIGU|nr:hypothetical protein, unknown function [Leishmania guyanensis]
MTHSLQSVLSTAAPCNCGPRSDSVTEAGLYLLRLTRVLEERVLEAVQQDMGSSTENEAELPLCEVHAAATSSSSGVGKQSSDTSTIRRRGRCYRVPGTSLSLRFPRESVDLLQTKLTTSPSLTEGETMCDLVRYHAELTLGLQQTMLWFICRLDTGIMLSSEEDGGVFGVLTHPRAVQLQWIFFDAVVQSVTSLQQRWSEDSACTGSVEAVGEVSVVLNGLAQAAQELRHPSHFPQLQVFELSESGTAHRSSPPFASWRSNSSATRASSDASTPLYSTSPRAPTRAQNSISECLGVVGADYSAKLTAQQLWCAQQLLSQRFTAYTAAWEVLERARFFVESTRSPTPTMPRSDSLQQVVAYAAVPSLVPAVELKCKRSSSHDGSTPPSCVTATQRKSERPYNMHQELGLPSRGLTFIEERAAAEVDDISTAQTDLTVSGSCLLTESPGVLSTPPVPSMLLPVSRCVLWDSFLASHSLSPTATLLAIQYLTASTTSSRPQGDVQHAHLGRPSSQSDFLCEVPANWPTVKLSKKDRPRVCSNETEPCRKAVGALGSASVHRCAHSS